MSCDNRKDLDDTTNSLLKKAKEFIEERKTDTKRDQLVDVLWDGVFEGLELASAPMKKALEKIEGIEKDVIESNWWKVTQTQKDVALMITQSRAVHADIVHGAGALKKYLSTLHKEESKRLVRALNGDLEPKELNDNMTKIYSQFRELIDTNADALIELGVLKDKDRIGDYLKRYYLKYVEEAPAGKGSSALAKMHKRKDLDHETRLAMGMIEDASFVVSKTLMEQGLLIEKAKLLKKVADTFAKDEKQAGYVRISDEKTSKDGVHKWGALAGKWVPLEVKRELGYSNLVAKETNAFTGFVYPLVDFLKVTLTVKNPVTHVYNIGSNITLAGIHGDLVHVGKIMWMAHKDKAAFNALLNKANKRGLNSQMDELEVFQIDLDPDKKKDFSAVNIAKTIVKNIYMAKDTHLGKTARWLYDWEDKIFKLAAFDRLMKEGMSEADAYAKAMEVYVDYSTPRPAAIAVLDKSGLMPFLHYQYKATPATAKVMLKNPLRAAMLGGGIVALKMGAFQNDDEESFTPEWARDKINLFGTQEWYEVVEGWYFNAGRMVPGTKFEFELGGFVKSILMIGGGKTPLGYDIDGKYDSAWETVYKRGLVLAENYTPSMSPSGRYGQRLIHIGLGEAGVVEPKKNYYKEDMTVQELALRALGVRKFNKASEVNKTLGRLTGLYGAGKFTKEEMEAQIKVVLDAAKKHGIKVDNKRLRSSLKRATTKHRKKAEK